jgi:hypothetical protein
MNVETTDSIDQALYTLKEIEDAYLRGVTDYVAILKNFDVKPHPHWAISIMEAKIKEQAK